MVFHGCSWFFRVFLKVVADQVWKYVFICFYDAETKTKELENIVWQDYVWPLRIFQSQIPKNPKWSETTDLGNRPGMWIFHGVFHGFPNTFPLCSHLPWLPGRSRSGVSVSNWARSKRSSWATRMGKLSRASQVSSFTCDQRNRKISKRCLDIFRFHKRSNYVLRCSDDFLPTEISLFLVEISKFWDVLSFWHVTTRPSGSAWSNAVLFRGATTSTWLPTGLPEVPMEVRHPKHPFFGEMTKWDDDHRSS